MYLKAAKIYAVVVFASLFFCTLAYGNNEGRSTKNNGGLIMDMVKDIKKAVVFIGDVDEKGKVNLYATGFLVRIQGIYHLLTAKHVVYDKNTDKQKDEKMHIFFNSKNGTIVGRQIQSQKKQFNINWIFHDNPDVDIAIIPFPLNPKDEDVKVVPDNLFTTSDKIFELYDIFFLSYQPGVEPKTKISPIFRVGTISVINDDKTFYIDAAAFPGNSGSPVFLKPSPIRFDQKGIALGGDKLGGTFVGIVGEYIPYQEIAVSIQTRKPRVIFEENTGLSKVWPVEFIEEIFKSESFKQQLDKIKATILSSQKETS